MPCAQATIDTLRADMAAFDNEIASTKVTIQGVMDAIAQTVQQRTAIARLQVEVGGIDSLLRELHGDIERRTGAHAHAVRRSARLCVYTLLRCNMLRRRGARTVGPHASFYARAT